jgi:transposase
MQVYIGIDWSEKKHDEVFMNEKGVMIAQLVIEHSPDGFHQLDECCRGMGLPAEEVVVGLETAHNLLIDHLWSRGYSQVYVIPPNVVKSNQGRYGSSGSMNDPKAAQLIADILRTDHQALRPWHPDSLLTRQMRAKVSLIIYLNREVNRLSNRLRAVLLRYYPLALEVFKGGLGSQITLALIQSYPNHQQAQQLSLAAFTAFTQAHHYTQKDVAGCFVRLMAEQPAPAQETVQIFQCEAVLLAKLLLELRQSELKERRELYQLFQQHPGFATFSSLPGTGEFLAPALCAKFGDDRQRFPAPNSVQALAGTCPATKSSGKGRWVFFRKACDREWRYICQLWAKALTAKNQSALASAYFSKVRRRNPSMSHAYRCLANRWLCIAWKLWQTQTEYNEAYHFEQVQTRSKPHR